MKTVTRVIAVIMLVAMLAAVMVACGNDKKDSYKDERIYGTWKQTDQVDGNWTWTFNDDGTCKLVGDTNGFNSEGTYRIENENDGKIHIKLNDWNEEKLFGYTITTKILSLTSLDGMDYRCEKQ